jgi:glycosyltransferase involved in cell wall biosynthesis
MAVVTIIVPVYNVERYLRRCLDSVLAQTFIDWECVIVDDGSPDGCPAICDEYAARDRRFRVIHKPRNEGLPAARMTGLSVVKTEYVMHLDSDDWLEKIALELLIKKAGESKAKIVIGNFNRITHSKIINHIYPQIKADTTPLEYYFLNGCVPLCMKLYKTELFTGIAVSPFHIGEDAVVNVQIFSKLRNGDLVNISEIIYNYAQNPESLLGNLEKRNYTPFLEYPWFVYREWIGSYIRNLNAAPVVMQAFDKYITGSISIYLLHNTSITKTDLYTISSYYKKLSKKRIAVKIRMFITCYCHFPFLMSRLVWLYKHIKFLFSNKGDRR